MNMKVVYMNNREGIVDSAILDQMIAWNKIRMFKRSDGWAMVGISPLRGSGGAYEGDDRRLRYGFFDNQAYSIVA